MASRNIGRGVSNVGREALFGTSEEEIERILKNEKNYYVVLKVLKDSDPSEIKINHRRLSLLVHPDKTSDPRAPDASAVLNMAKGTLLDPVKKRLYDSYVEDVDLDTATSEEPMTYAQWEASQGQVKIPAWAEKLLRIPLLGSILGLILLLLLLAILLVAVPLTIAIVMVLIILSIIMIPINAVFRCLCGKSDAADEEFAEAARSYETTESAV